MPELGQVLTALDMGCSSHAIDKPSLETEVPTKITELSGEGRGVMCYWLVSQMEQKNK